MAISLDGYISGIDGDISGFAQASSGVQKYLDDLQKFKTVIMGKNTYTFGYQFGMQPGDAPYPHMQHYIFSDSLILAQAQSNVHIKKYEIEEIQNIRNSSESDIYLCGGGLFAGWLLEHQQIDLLKLKINPLILGAGTQLFGDSNSSHQLQLMESDAYDQGLLINTYKIIYEPKSNL